jgi:hypothetical protein
MSAILEIREIREGLSVRVTEARHQERMVFILVVVGLSSKLLQVYFGSFRI